MKHKYWIIFLILVCAPRLDTMDSSAFVADLGNPNEYPELALNEPLNFGFEFVELKEGLPTPVRNSAFMVDTANSDKYPELIYVSKDNKAWVFDTESLVLKFPLEIEGNIKRVLAKDINSDGTTELVVLSDLKIAVYSSDGMLKWKKDLDSAGVDAGLMKDINGERYQIVVASKDHLYIYSFEGILTYSKETDENSRLIVANIGQTPSEEIILIHESSISAFFYNGVLWWKNSFAEPISVVCVFSPREKSLLVSLRDGAVYSVNEWGEISSIGDLKIDTAALIPFKLNMTAFPAGFFVISKDGQLTAYNLDGKEMKDLTQFREIFSIIPCDLDNRLATICGIPDYRPNEEGPNREEYVVVSKEGEVSVLIYSSAEHCEQQDGNCWVPLPLGIDNQGNKITNVKTDMKDILFSLVFRMNGKSYLLLMDGNGTLHKYEIFQKANKLLMDFDASLLKYEQGDYVKVHNLLKDRNQELAKYYTLDDRINDMLNTCENEMNKEEELLKGLIKKGFEEKGEGKLKNALQDLSEAYSGFERRNPRDESIVYELDNTRLTFLDLRKEIVLLCLLPIGNADKAMKEERYEDALHNFALVYKYWSDFHDNLPLIRDSSEDSLRYKEYKETYSDIGNIYTPDKIKESITFCVNKITEEAERLRELGELEKSKEKYDLVINDLIEANWSDGTIRELEKKRSDVETLISEKCQQILQIIKYVSGILSISFAAILFYRYYKERDLFALLSSLIMVVLILSKSDELRRFILTIVVGTISVIIPFFLGLKESDSLPLDDRA